MSDEDMLDYKLLAAVDNPAAVADSLVVVVDSLDKVVVLRKTAADFDLTEEVDNKAVAVDFATCLILN